MRKKELKLIITFHTTADAIAFEKACKASGIPGRMIPIPREISAGCGLSWCTAPEERSHIEEFIKAQQIETGDIEELLY